jgi:hypothetical protein
MADKFQVFISFKNLDENGTPTEDRRLAEEVHAFLTGKGLRVFMSTVTLEQLGVAAYKKAIDDALDSSSAVVVVGTSRDNLDSPWVRYEWDSYFNDILTGVRPSGRVFAYVKGVPTRELPRPLRQTTTISHSPDGMESLHHFIVNALGAGLRAANVERGPESRASETASVKATVGSTLGSQDVFLSYPSEKREWVRINLYGPLTAWRGEGRVFFDAHEWDPGAGWLGQVAEALERCRVFIPVYCHEYFTSDFCRWELSKAAMRDPLAINGFITPVRLDDVDVPLAVSHIESLDARGEDFQARLLARLELPLGVGGIGG